MTIYHKLQSNNFKSKLLYTELSLTLQVKYTISSLNLKLDTCGKFLSQYCGFSILDLNIVVREK